ncbi:hypothetical protein ACGYK5_17790 [Sulfitobacter sp. 1A16787]|uniref:hypothetical protein n=1 Tax=Sulfitobacter sp. 1A16787 TaxID=3368571 RepID=UPI003746DE48
MTLPTRDTDLAAALQTLRNLADAIHTALAQGADDPRGKKYVVADDFGALTFTTKKQPGGMTYAEANGRAPAHEVNRWSAQDAITLAEATGGRAVLWATLARQQLAGMESLISQLEQTAIAA